MQKTAKKSSNAFGVLLLIILPLIIYLLGFLSVLNDRAFYRSQFEENGINMTIGMETTGFLLDYFGTRNGGLPNYAYFDEKEAEHIMDVKEIIQSAVFLLLLLIISAAVYIYGYCHICNWSRVLLIAGGITAAIPLILYFIPFGALFNLFHAALFEPGTWVFPKGSFLVTVYPANFFYSAAYAIFMRSFVTGWLLIISGFIVGKILK